MKLNVFKENKEEEFYLKLIENGEGIELNVVDKNGNRVPCGTILSIINNNLILSNNISSKFGLELNSNGKIKIDD